MRTKQREAGSKAIGSAIKSYERSSGQICSESREPIVAVMENVSELVGDFASRLETLKNENRTALMEVKKLAAISIKEIEGVSLE